VFLWLHLLSKIFFYFQSIKNRSLKRQKKFRNTFMTPRPLFLECHVLFEWPLNSNLMVGQNGCVFAHSRVLWVNKQAECTKFWAPWALLKASAGNIWSAGPLLCLSALNIFYAMFPTMIWQGWHMLRALKCTKQLFFKRIFNVAFHLVMFICDTLTAVDAPLFSLFDWTLFKTLNFWNLRYEAMTKW